MPQNIWLHKGEKAFREKSPIVMNNVFDLYRQSISNLQHKGNSFSLKFQT